MTEKYMTCKPSAITWQDGDDESIGEPAISYTRYSDGTIIEMRQGGNSILINHGSIPEVIKTLRDLHKGASE
jgi:hypothetical protein